MVNSCIGKMCICHRCLHRPKAGVWSVEELTFVGGLRRHLPRGEGRLLFCVVFGINFRESIMKSPSYTRSVDHDLPGAVFKIFEQVLFLH